MALYRLEAIIKEQSTIKEYNAIKATKQWVNERQNSKNNIRKDGSYKRDYYAELFDSRTLKTFKIFSDVSAIERGIQSRYMDIDGVIDASPKISNNLKEPLILIKGTANITSKDGKLKIKVDNSFRVNKTYTVFLQVKNSLTAKAVVENQCDDEFTIALYDTTYFSDDAVPLDCSKNNILVDYVAFT